MILTIIPLIPTYDSTYTYLDYTSILKINMFISSFNYNIDKNLLYNEYKTDKFNKYTKQENILQSLFERKPKLKDVPPKLDLARFYIRSDYNHPVVTITFNKIPELLSKISAIFTNSFLVLRLILSRWNEFKAKQAIFSVVYKIKDLYYLNFWDAKKKHEEILLTEFNKTKNFSKRRSNINFVIKTHPHFDNRLSGNTEILRCMELRTANENKGHRDFSGRSNYIHIKFS